MNLLQKILLFVSVAFAAPVQVQAQTPTDIAREALRLAFTECPIVLTSPQEYLNRLSNSGLYTDFFLTQTDQPIYLESNAQMGPGASVAAHWQKFGNTFLYICHVSKNVSGEPDPESLFTALRQELPRFSSAVFSGGPMSDFPSDKEGYGGYYTHFLGADEVSLGDGNSYLAEIYTVKNGFEFSIFRQFKGDGSQ